MVISREPQHADAELRSQKYPPENPKQADGWMVISRGSERAETKLRSQKYASKNPKSLAISATKDKRP
jgi:hypothetical protein